MGTRSRFGRRCALRVLAAVVALGAGTTVGAGDGEPARVVLTGTVVDEAGKPVAGAEVSATGRPKPDAVRSDAKGAFRLLLPANPSGRVYTTLVARDRARRLGVLHVFRSEDTPAKPLEVVLKPVRTLDVQVVDRDRRPVEGTEVHFVVNFQEIVAGRTDAEGRWTTTVPADANGWAVYAHKSRAGFDYALAERARGSTEPPLPLPEQLTLVLDGARPPLRIKTIDADGKPLAGIDVGPWLIQKPGRESEMNGMTGAFVKTNEDGVATLDWLPERTQHGFTILAHSADYDPADHATRLPADKPVDLVTITLLPNERLSGRVTTADGRPAADVAVSVHGQGAGTNDFQGATRTDAAGRYALRVHSEQAYIITASQGDLAAPYRSGVVVRAGKPVGDVDLVLGPGTRVRGRVTVGKDRTPAARINVQAVIDKGSIPDELKRKDDRHYHGMMMTLWKPTDDDGRFEFLLGPGEYTIRGPARVEPVKLTIPAEDPPAELVRDFAMPRPDSGAFTATVVDADGEPVARAVVDGAYRSMHGWFNRVVADARGTIRVQRSLDPLVLRAEAPDKSRAAVVRVDAEAAEARVVVKPTSSASGRLTDPQGTAIAGRKLNFGVRVHQGPTRTSPFSWHFGGTTTTDDAGRFRLAGLVVGETYELYASDEEGRRLFTAKTPVIPARPGPFELGDVVIDTSPPKPYVPPTPAERAGQSFAARKEKTPREKLDDLLIEARREYTRPLLLFGDPKDPACVDLFRAFDEPSKAEQDKGKSPADLRWEFELASLDATQANVKALAKDLRVPFDDGGPPRLAVLSEEGGLTATYPLRLGENKTLDGRALGAFLLEHKRPTRDAEAMLAEGLARAKAEDKRVFLIMSASWCGPCRMLARFLAANKGELGRHYVFVKLDVSRDTGAERLKERYEGKDASNGIPWYVILDPAGKPLVTSNAKEPSEDSSSTNIGFPSSKEGIDHFLGMLGQTAPRLSEQALAALRRGLEKKP